MTSTRLSRAARVDAATPASRNRVVDFLRAAARWWCSGWIIGRRRRRHPATACRRALDPSAHLAVPGDADLLPGGRLLNALSWRSARRKDLSYGQWLRTRLRRLGIPLIPLLLAWLVIGVVAVVAGAPHVTVQLASQMALIPTWFLAAYLMVILVAPPCLVLWERFGWFSILGGVALAGAVDALSLVTDQPLLGYPNYLLVWAAFHQVGYAWLDGRLSGAGRRLLLAAIGLVGLLLLVLVGPYPVSMITSAADDISNSSPTRITMAFLGMLQAGLVLSLERPLTALLRRPGLWFLTVLVNQRIMTWFLCTSPSWWASPTCSSRSTPGRCYRAADRPVVGDAAGVGAGAVGAHRAGGAGDGPLRRPAGRRQGQHRRRGSPCSPRSP